MIGNRRPKDITISIADNKKLNNLIKWTPKYKKLSDVVNSSLKWYIKEISKNKIYDEN